MESEKYFLSWSDFSTNTTASIQELRSETELFDVTLACEDHQLQAHKVVLASSSPVFRKILTRNKDNAVIYLRGVSKEHLESMLEYVYNGSVQVNHEQLQTFLGIASDFKLKGLSNFDQSDLQTYEPFETKSNIGDIQQNLPIPMIKEEIVKEDQIDPGPGAKKITSRRKGPTEKKTSDGRVLGTNNFTLEPPPEIIKTEEEIRQYDNLVYSKMEKKNEMWVCLECDREFQKRLKNCAYRHIDLSHMSQYTFLCSNCPKSVVAKSNLMYHRKNCRGGL